MFQVLYMASEAQVRDVQLGAATAWGRSEAPSLECTPYAL